VVDLRPVLILITTLPLGLIAVVLGMQAWRGLHRANAARSWPRVTGWVVRSGVRSATVRVRSSISASRYRTALRYAPQVIYQYEVEGRRYEGERLHMGDTAMHSGEAVAERSAARYPVGSQVTVYYDPANPADATLDPRTGWGTRVLGLVALGVLGIALVVAAVFIASPPISP
jgi:uncharacterized protein DUF3592